MPSKPWAELSSAERMDAVLLAVAALEGEAGAAPAASVAHHVQAVMGHEMVPPRHGNHGRGNVARRMNDAVRVTPAITALRAKGLITFGRRPDGMSGTADRLTAQGRARVAELRNTTTNEETKMSEKTIEELIEQVREATGAEPDAPDRAVREHEGFTYGDRVRVLDDVEEEGVFADDEGVLVIERVGAAEYQNERVMLGLIPDGMDGAVEVTSDNIEQV
jgi:hypothetical protein